MNLSYNISFAVAGLIISIIIILVVSLYYSSSNIVNKRFKRYLIASIIMMCLDLFTVVTNDNPGLIPNSLNIVLNGLYFFSGSLVALLFLFYCVTVAFPTIHKKARLITYYVNIGALTLLFITLVINCFNGMYFYFDENLTYTRGPLYLLINVLAVLYVIESVIIFIIGRRNFNKRQLWCTSVFMIVFFGSFLLQLFVFPTVLLSDFGGAIGSLVVFFSIETPDYSQLVKTLEELNNLKKSLEQQVQERTRELEIEKQSYQDLTIETLSSLAILIDAKDHYTKGHSTRVATFAKILGKKCGLSDSEAEILYFAGLVHDVGKIGISELIIRKPGPLTKEEFEIIKSHPTLGGEILKGIKKFKIFEKVARHHHERYDGTGYPKKLKSVEIPFEARIVAICDSFDAMMSDRSYRKALSLEEAISELEKGKGTQFDPVIVDKFLEIIKEDGNPIVANIGKN